MSRFCAACNNRYEPSETRCSRCGSTAVSAIAQVHGVSTIGLVGAIGTVADSHLPDGSQAIEQTTTKGARASGRLSADGISLNVSGPIELGRAGEHRVLDLVVSELRHRGHATELRTARDDRGEDGKVVCDGIVIELQIVTLPIAPTFWKDARTGSASTELSFDQAASWIHDATALKSKKYAAPHKQQMLLVLDAEYSGIVIAPPVVAAYAAMFPDPTTEFGFAGVWLIGPTSSRCTVMGTSRW